MPIYEQTFHHYEGPRSTSKRWIPIARMTLRPFRTEKRNLVFPVLLFGQLIIGSVLFYIAGVARAHFDPNLEAASRSFRIPLPGLSIGLETLCFIYIMSSLVLVWLMLLQHAGAICNDLRNGALVLYFARPLRLRDYVAGKMVGLIAVPLGIMSVTIIVSYVEAVAFVLDPDQVLPAAVVAIKGLIAALAFNILLVLSLLASSAVARSERTVGVLYVIYWFLTPPVVRALAKAADTPSLLNFSPTEMLRILLTALLLPEASWTGDRMVHQAASYRLLAVIAFCLYAFGFLLLLIRRVRSVEVVR